MSVLSIRPADPRRDAYVARGREALATVLPSVRFDAPVWDVRDLAATAATRAQDCYFTAHGTTTDVLPPSYAEPVKAWVVVAGGTASRWNSRAQAARWLWRALSERLGEGAGDRFTWRDLQHADLHRAEQLMVEAKMKSAYKMANTMGDLARALGRAGVAAPIVYTPFSPRKRSSDNPSVEDLDAAPEGALTESAQDALADIFFRATSLRDRFFSALMALLIATGLRWHEVLTLPRDPLEEVESDVRGPTGALRRIRMTRVRRHKGKSKRAGGAGRKSLETEWLTDVQAELARLAVARLQDLCAPAREVAARLEKTAPRWVWPGGTRPAYVVRDDLIDLFDGCHYTNANLVLAGIDSEPIPDYQGRGSSPPRRATLATFEQYMTERQDWRALAVVKGSRGQTAQAASASLVCVRVNEVHENRAVLPLVAAVTHEMLEAWLTGDPALDAPSVFDRFEREHSVRYREPDGSPVKVDSHMARRLFVTNGLIAGASTLDLARLQGREHLGDLSAYDKRSMAERVAAVKDAIRSGRLKGTVATVYRQLADDVRDAWLADQVRSMHVTPLGLCVHDFDATPCPFADNCVKHCSDFLTDPSDPTVRVQLVQLERRTREVLEDAEPDVAAGRIAPSWVEEQRQTLSGVRAILAAEAPAAGGLVAPFAGGQTRYQSLGEVPIGAANRIARA